MRPNLVSSKQKKLAPFPPSIQSCLGKKTNVYNCHVILDNFGFLPGSQEQIGIFAISLNRFCPGLYSNCFRYSLTFIPITPRSDSPLFWSNWKKPLSQHTFSFFWTWNKAFTVKLKLSHSDYISVRWCLLCDVTMDMIFNSLCVRRLFACSNDDIYT